ncbi:hypothetical protein FRC11_012714, partial [Ceratobasidium sp. 423]
MFGTNVLEVSISSASGGDWTNLKSLIRSLEQAGSTLGRIKGCLEELLQLTEVYE